MLRRLEIAHFRCIERADLTFDARVTAIVGPNGSGKTSVLEAIYFLTHGRSFRAPQREKLAQRGTQTFQIVGRAHHHGREHVAGIQYADGHTEVHLDGSTSGSFSEISLWLPTQLIDPGVHRLIEEGSARRRRLLDWGVFHVEPHYLHVWRRFQRALMQRNAALRSDAPQAAMDWEPEMLMAADLIDAARQRYYEALSPLFMHWSARLLGFPVDVRYRRGWPQDAEFATVLSAHRSRDQQLRTTTSGPHRADLSFHVERAAARDLVSRGQQKLLAAALVLAQVKLHAADRAEVCLLLDDPAAELDVDNLGKLYEALDEVPAQLVVTAVHSQSAEALNPGRMFHVEQGCFTPML